MPKILLKAFNTCLQQVAILQGFLRNNCSVFMSVMDKNSEWIIEKYVIFTNHVGTIFFYLNECDSILSKMICTWTQAYVPSNT